MCRYKVKLLVEPSSHLLRHHVSLPPSFVAPYYFYRDQIPSLLFSDYRSLRIIIFSIVNDSGPMKGPWLHTRTVSRIVSYGGTLGGFSHPYVPPSPFRFWVNACVDEGGRYRNWQWDGDKDDRRENSSLLDKVRDWYILRILPQFLLNLRIESSLRLLDLYGPGRKLL